MPTIRLLRRFSKNIIPHCRASFRALWRPEGHPTGKGILVNALSHRQFTHGTTLLEVLVAILVLSFGMLGMLGLLMTSLKLTASSNYRNIATLESQAMADLVRANARNLTLYNSPANTVNSSCFTDSGCTSSTTRVQTEYSLWLGRLGSMLPSGSGIICRDSTPTGLTSGTPSDWACDNAAGSQFVVKVCWDESRVPTSPVITCVQTNM